MLGDWYLNTTTGDVSEKTGTSAWTLRGNIKGPQGDPGDPGAEGPKGDRGEVWFSSTGTPTAGTGVVGDWHLNATTGIFSEKTGTSTWTARGSLMGPQGDTGATGEAEGWHGGTAVPASGLGEVGDWYLNTTTGVVSEKTDVGTWTTRGNIKGPTGATGPVSTVPGPVGPTGSQGPVGATGSQGVAGPKGDPGVQGPQGPQGTTGEGIHILGELATPGDLPSTGNAPGDAYIVTSDGDLYVWTAQTDPDSWIDAGQVVGPQGPAGPQGVQGPAGATGSQGVAGPAGAQGIQGVKGDTGAAGATQFPLITRAALNALAASSSLTAGQPYLVTDAVPPVVAVASSSTTYVNLVSAPVITSLDVAPATASVNAGSTQQLTATATWSDSSTTNVTSTATWTTTDATKATVSSSGLVNAVAVGTATITAATSGVSDTCAVTVTSVVYDSLKTEAQVPGTTVGSDGAIELGTRFRRLGTSPIVVRGVRFYRSTVAQSQAPVVYLAPVGGSILATKTALSATPGAAGWETVLFDTPVTVSNSTDHIIWIWLPGGGYYGLVNGLGADTPSRLGLFEAPFDGGKFKQPPAGTNGNSEPVASFQSAFYWVDPLVTAT